MKKNLNIYYSDAVKKQQGTDADNLLLADVIRLAKSKDFLQQLFRYKNINIYSPEFYTFSRPFLTMLICRLMAGGRCVLWNDSGKSQAIGIFVLLREFFALIKEHLFYQSALKKVKQELDSLCASPSRQHKLDTGKTPVYLRCDPFCSHIAGGSIGHIAGVLNNLDTQFDKQPVLISTDEIPTVRAEIEKTIVSGNIPYRNVRSVSSLFANDLFYNTAREALKQKDVSILYQRSGLNCYSGAKLAQDLSVPYVLEYNGSEVWVTQHWAKRKLKAFELSVQVEELTFRQADLITCVSQPLKDELLSRGIPEEKIIVNPNGVDTDVYCPEVDGTAIRDLYGIDKDTVLIGFIGTFGPWHGAEVLAKAFATLIKQPPCEKLKLILIGDGARMPQVKSILSEAGAMEHCIFTGMITQSKGPSYLAACDVLVSPQIRNPDGTPFFGSPTKLFEYMAMGKAIAASDLDQMGEILEHEKTALLCEPGNEQQLVQALSRLACDRNLRETLGANARREAVEKHTWKQHVNKIIAALRKQCK